MMLLLLFPSLALASINVSINGVVYYDDDNKLKENAYGSANQNGFDQHKVTDEDLSGLKIDYEQLKNIIESIHGLKPDQVLVRSGVDYGNIYKKQGWNEVQIKIEPVAADYTLSFEKQSVNITETENVPNPTNKSKNMPIKRSKTFNNYIKSTWKPPKVNGRNVNVKFDFEIDGNPVSDFQKEFPIGDNVRTAVHENIVQEQDVYLLPNESVQVNLRATKGTVIFAIPYKVTLSGDVVVMYNSAYKNKHFFKFDINELLAAKQNSTTIVMNQTIAFEFYYDTVLYIIHADGTISKSFNNEHSIAGSSGKRKATAKKEFESTEGFKLRKSVPAELIEYLYKAEYKETNSESEESSELD